MSAKRITILALMVALLTGGKTALAWAVPNVEIVTLLLVAYALILPRRDALFVTIIFVLIEILIWGFLLWWVVLYIIYWPSLVLVVSLLKEKINRRGDILSPEKEKLYNKRVIFAAIIGVAFTMFFGVLSSFIDVVFIGGIASITSGIFWQSFVSWYMAGIFFYVVHVASSIGTLFFVLPFLYRALKKLITKIESDSKKSDPIDDEAV
ncbi:MAG: hypothetical protein FWE22_05560 [Firmicutes bacterium]|nr:hypothetical protein [Bacillota bacterium]